MIATAVALLASLISAEIREWPSSGGFDIVQLEYGCALQSDYTIPGRSPVRMALISDGAKTRLILTSMDWSSREGEEYELAFSIGDWTYTGTVTGVNDYVYKGFVASFDQEFIDVFAAAPSLYITRGDAVVANLSLRGTAGATTVLRRCVSHFVESNVALAAQQRRFDYIAADPFADPPTDTAQNVPSKEGFDPATDVRWSRPPRPEFPARATEHGIRQATVTLECATRANGALASCSIVSESPTGMGFGQAALAAVSNSRLSPDIADQAPSAVRFALPFIAN